MSDGATRSSGLLFWGVVVAAIAVMVTGIIFTSRFDRDITLTQSPLIDEPVPDVGIRLLDSPDEFKLFELTPKPNIALTIGDRVYIGKDVDNFF